MVNVGAVIGGIVAAIAIIVVIIIGSSFSYLEYFQYGFKRTKSTGAVDITNTYSFGRYFLGPDAEFKIFPADAHYVNYNSVSVFTKDKLEVRMTVTLQYFVLKSELPLLHQEYDLFYESILESNGLDALKGAATVYSTDEFISRRSDIEKALFKGVRERLGGRCCIKDCEKTSSCYSGCKAYSTCQKSDKGLFAQVKYFQLAEVTIPKEVESRKLKALTLEEETETEKYNQNASLVQKETDLQVKRGENEAAEITQKAKADSTLLLARAVANATAIREKARSEGLKDLYAKTKLTTKEHKASFDYLRTLRDIPNVHLNIDFNQLIAGPTSLGKD
ncbi:uncharacterized protein LOC135499719 [Lineus longissimus]|uniref:uncharacterized protein LOC135499719 n=1 Tax=Lineus longissimus TaxID=88925 RepID=UPI002B4C3814